MAKHKMVSLERKQSGSDEVAAVDDEPFFPHSMFLNNEDIDKLGVGDTELGDEFEFHAKARVTSISASQNTTTKDRNITVSFVEGELNKPTKSQAERLFGGRDGGGK